MCWEFKWTADYVLKMPAKRFFSMYAAMRKLKALYMAELCDLYALPLSNSAEYYKHLKERYMNEIRDVPDSVYEASKAESKKAMAPVFEAGSVEAKAAIIGLFSAARGAR